MKTTTKQHIHTMEFSREKDGNTDTRYKEEA